MSADYTYRQGQYLAFIHYYTKLHGRAPAEADMQQYFKVTPPTIHQTVKTLDEKGYIERVPRKALSIRILLPPDELPDLE